jgi:uncharacterized spore protein YtfJ
MGNDSFGYGQADPNDAGSDFKAIAFVVSQMTAKMSTSKLVQVQAVHGGGINPAGTVDVLPLVQQIDGNGYGLPHGTVYGLPWSRVQGGANAVICDPQVGDVGYVVAADRDISVVKAQSPGFTSATGFVPASRRRFNISDGIYAGGCLNVTPTQYLIFTATGVRLVDLNGNSVSMGPTGVNFTDLNGNQIQMAAGFVNVVTASFRVNGVPVTVP